MTHDEIMTMVREHVRHALDAKARIDQADLEALSAALGDRVASVQLDLPSKVLTVRLQPAAVIVELGFAFSWRHDFVWRHVPGTLCDGRHICEHLDHWEVRCSRCGEPECTLSRESACEGRGLVERCDHCGKPERFNVLCADCEAKACDKCGRVDCCCVLKPCSGHEVYGCPLCDVEVSP